MKFYTSIRHIQLDEQIAHKAWEFARAVTPTTDYSDSHQSFIEKIKEDHFVSRLGEEAVKKLLEQFAEVKGPDYKIYAAKEKSWDDDLYINGTGLAVKTQKKSAADKYGLSWTFQCGLFRRDVILDKPEAWVVFVECDDQDPYHFRLFPPFQIKELCFEEPRLKHLSGHKKVVYAEKLPL